LKEEKYYEPGYRAAMMLLLRRTLVLLICYSAYCISINLSWLYFL